MGEKEKKGAAMQAETDSLKGMRTSEAWEKAPEKPAVTITLAGNRGGVFEFPAEVQKIAFA